MIDLWAIREMNTPLTAKATVLLTDAFRKSLDELASRRRMSLADVVRQSMLAGLPVAFPEFVDIYRENLKGESNV